MEIFRQLSKIRLFSVCERLQNPANIHGVLRMDFKRIPDYFVLCYCYAIFISSYISFYCLGSLSLSFCNTRKENTVLNRLHIGHSYLTHSFILRKKEAPVCVACNVVLTVKHILIECADFLEIRKKYFEEKSLYSLFRNVIPEVVFDFLREIGVFYKV